MGTRTKFISETLSENMLISEFEIIKKFVFFNIRKARALRTKREVKLLIRMMRRKRKRRTRTYTPAS